MATLTATATITAGSSVVGAVKAHFIAAAVVVCTASMGAAPPTITHNFKPLPIPKSTVAVVRTVPQTPPTTHAVIQPPKPPTQAGPSVQINVKR